MNLNPPPTFKFDDPHYPDLVPEPVEECDCARCTYLREFNHKPSSTSETGNTTHAR